MERVTLNTNVLLELWKNQDRRAMTEELLRRARAGEFELAVTRVIEADVPHDVHFSAGARGRHACRPPQFVTAVPNWAPGQTFLLHPGPRHPGDRGGRRGGAAARDLDVERVT